MIDTLTDPLIVTMIGYFAVTLAVGVWYGRGAGEGYVEFTLAGRNLSLPVYLMTYFATFAGSGLTMGLAQQAFVEGISAQWYAMTQGLAWMTMTLFIGFIYSFDVVSVPELLGRVYGDYTQYFAGLFTVAGQVALTAGQTIGMASVLAVTTGIDLATAFWISVVIFVSLTAYGGMSTVAYTDTLHGVVIIGGMIVAIPLAVSNVGGVGAIAADVPGEYTNWFGVGVVQIGTWYLMYLTVAGAQQQMLQRTWSARSRRVAMFGTFLAGTIITGFGILSAAAGMIASAQGADISSEMAFAWTITNTLPDAFAGLLLAAAVSSVITGADSFLLAGATSFINDIYIPLRGGHEAVDEDRLVLITRVAIVVFGVGAALIAFSGIDIIVINTLGMGIMSVLFAGLLMLLWDGTVREAGLPGFVVGGVVFTVWEFVLGSPEIIAGEGQVEPAVPATLSALATIWLVSVLYNGETFTNEKIRELATEDMDRLRADEVASDD
ncbi:sodium:solute symporter family protein [Natronococcus jeotgali]|uniref:SSS sodium solute transporter superfamily protein n=1 Tax=Natronococcus jeotgali DSM 18795 TaxID=1227498 RepID=L9XSX4_9EURY|nr:sodium:solute symporter family protein [Natronococcus jeotgali]ELY64637.1 SSS sodium solute transporter superfamily protein [Natronococcus jeotgali DSM 18795]